MIPKRIIILYLGFSSTKFQAVVAALQGITILIHYNEGC